MQPRSSYAKYIRELFIWHQIEPNLSSKDEHFLATNGKVFSKVNADFFLIAKNTGRKL